ncbi:helix-turn-helix domain-containing protein, partial [Lysobacter sp. 1R34A]|uniref:helix-turn-helix domain-containing protein n=1 Tax=Lysobacter sp. 1R34A TaxID=3445786 RepID=UPI003EF05D94
ESTNIGLGLVLQPVESLYITVDAYQIDIDDRIILSENPADPRGLADWAAFAHLSERSLSRRFAAQTGHSLLQWRQRARLMRAMERLAGGDAVTAIALDLGYDSVSAFIAMFRRSLGASPTAYLARLGT